ncbi:DUF3305 domain-containing protein [Tepidicella xavieri]|uniref:Uncharacterized protein DUF3305 n=1 Tax=Tepidicella xavieri TaxID=360241 RepID=A0A4R6U5V8_9BURK|nr:DUF3305 domain-containing protein [Tepidicella xavieri]TDQ38424.1 uncharacterized protein DUF3305 [Tepidicella xavieri]
MAMDAPQETVGAIYPAIEVGVIMRREPVIGPMSRWQSTRWVLADVVLHEALPALSLAGAAEAGGPIPIEPEAGASPATSHWLYPGFEVTLHRDDAEGYYLNLTAPQPCFWVLWRLDHEQGDDAFPQPLIVTVSYHDAGRWLDAQERVDQVPAPPSVIDWMARFTQQHYQPEPKRRKRPASFQPLTDRFGNPVCITTDKARGGAGHG